MSSYCPQGLYFTMNGVNYYYCQSCDSCSYVCVALNTVPDCGGCCTGCCPEACNELITNADPQIVDYIKREPNPTIPVKNVAINNYAPENGGIKRHRSGIFFDSDEIVAMVADVNHANQLCKLRLISVRVETAGPNPRLLWIGQEVDPLTVSGREVKKTFPRIPGTYHRVQFVQEGDDRRYDVITLNNIP